eukprot:6479888-Amphidinium_carterae.1
MCERTVHSWSHGTAGGHRRVEFDRIQLPRCLMLPLLLACRDNSCSLSEAQEVKPCLVLRDPESTVHERSNI